MSGLAWTFGSVAGLVGAGLLLGPRGSRTIAPEHTSGSPSALTDARRAKLPSYDFVFPEDRSYPVHDRDHGQKALVFVAAPSNRLRRYRVMRVVFARYPGLREWWNTTRAGHADPANVNSWRTTLYQYQALAHQVPEDERADVEAEVEALQALLGQRPPRRSSGKRRSSRKRRAA